MKTRNGIIYNNKSQNLHVSRCVSDYNVIWILIWVVHSWMSWYDTRVEQFKCISYVHFWVEFKFLTPKMFYYLDNKACCKNGIKLEESRSIVFAVTVEVERIPHVLNLIDDLAFPMGWLLVREGGFCKSKHN